MAAEGGGIALRAFVCDSDRSFSTRNPLACGLAAGCGSIEYCRHTVSFADSHILLIELHFPWWQICLTRS